MNLGEEIWFVHTQFRQESAEIVHGMKAGHSGLSDKDFGSCVPKSAANFGRRVPKFVTDRLLEPLSPISAEDCRNPLHISAEDCRNCAFTGRVQFTSLLNHFIAQHLIYFTSPLLSTKHSPFHSQKRGQALHCH